MKCVECGRAIFPHSWTGPSRFHHFGRGLCMPCYGALGRQGYLNDCPRLTHPSSELATKWADMKDRGWTRREAAAQLDVTLAGLEKAITRHNRTHADSRSACPKRGSMTQAGR